MPDGSGGGALISRSLETGSNEHYTPRFIAEAVTYVLGRIHLDPASCAEGNKVIGADLYYSTARGEDGLQRAKSGGWHGNVFLNPPGGTIPPEGGASPSSKRGEGSAPAWWRALVRQWECGNVAAAVFLAFNMNVFRTAQVPPRGSALPFADVMPPFMFPFCVPAKRIAFDKMADGVRVTSKSPPQDSAIILLPPKSHSIDNYAAVGCEARFAEAFGRLGAVRM